MELLSLFAGPLKQGLASQDVYCAHQFFFSKAATRQCRIIFSSLLLFQLFQSIIIDGNALHDENAKALPDI